MVLRNVAPGTVVIEGRAEDGTSARTMVTVVTGKTVNAQLIFPTATAPQKGDEGMSFGTTLGIGGGVLLVGAIATWIALSNQDTTTVHQASLCIDQGCND